VEKSGDNRLSDLRD